MSDGVAAASEMFMYASQRLERASTHPSEGLATARRLRSMLVSGVKEVRVPLKAEAIEP